MTPSDAWLYQLSITHKQYFTPDVNEWISHDPTDASVRGDTHEGKGILSAVHEIECVALNCLTPCCTTGVELQPSLQLHRSHPRTECDPDGGGGEGKPCFSFCDISKTWPFPHDLTAFARVNRVNTPHIYVTTSTSTICWFSTKVLKLCVHTVQ